MYTDPRDIVFIVIQAPEPKFATRIFNAAEGERGRTGGREDRQPVLIDD